MSKREAILQATIDVVAKFGIANSPTDLIAKEAGAAQLTLFRLFGSKKELLRQANKEIEQRIQDVLWPAIESAKNLDQKLESLLRAGIKYFRKCPSELAYMQEYNHSIDGLTQRPDLLCDKGEDISRYPLISILNEGRAQGIFKNLRMCALVGLTGAPIIMVLREEQLMNFKLKKVEIDLLVQSCLQAVKA
jgi:AcrR family transcriptional regulator